MSRIPYTNTLSVAVYIGGVCVPAGGTRTVDAALLAPVAAPDAPPSEDPLLALAGGSVKEIIAAIPGVSDDDLAGLIELERAASKPRKTLIEMLELAKLERLDQRDQAEAAAKAAATDDAAADAEPQA
jgi:hypothetical protein